MGESVGAVWRASEGRRHVGERGGRVEGEPTGREPHTSRSSSSPESVFTARNCAYLHPPPPILEGGTGGHPRTEGHPPSSPVTCPLR